MLLFPPDGLFGNPETRTRRNRTEKPLAEVGNPGQANNGRPARGGGGGGGGGGGFFRWPSRVCRLYLLRVLTDGTIPPVVD